MKKMSMFILVGIVFVFACKKNKDDESAPLPEVAVYNPVGDWFLERTPLTVNGPDCGDIFYGVHSDTVTVSLNGSQATLHKENVYYSGTYTNNTLLVSRTVFNFIDAAMLTDTYELGLKSDRQATGLETWSLQGDINCSGTHSAKATKIQ